MKVISTILSTILASLLFHGALSATLRGDSAENAAPLNSDIKALSEKAGKYRDLLKDGSLFTGMYHKDRMMAAASCPYSFIKSATKKPTSAYSFCYFESEFSNSTGVECYTVSEGYDLIAFFVGSTSQNSGMGMGGPGSLPIETLTGQIIYIPDGMGPTSASSSPSDLMGAATTALDKKPGNDFYFIASPVNTVLLDGGFFEIPLVNPYTLPFGNSACGVEKLKVIRFEFAGFEGPDVVVFYTTFSTKGLGLPQYY